MENPSDSNEMLTQLRDKISDLTTQESITQANWLELHNMIQGFSAQDKKLAQDYVKAHLVTPEGKFTLNLEGDKWDSGLPAAILEVATSVTIVISGNADTCEQQAAAIRAQVASCFSITANNFEIIEDNYNDYQYETAIGGSELELNDLTIVNRTLDTITFMEATFNNCNFRNVDFQKVIFSGDIVFWNCQFTNCKNLPDWFTYYLNRDMCVTVHHTVESLSQFCQPDANLRGLTIEDSSHIIKNLDLSDTDLTQALFVGTNFQGVKFNNSNLENSYITDVQFIDCDFSGALLKKAYFASMTFSNCDFSNADLREITWDTLGEFSGVNFTHANLANNNLHNADFSGANLSYSNVEASDFSGSDLTGANLSGIKNLDKAILKDACFADAIGLPTWLSSQLDAEGYYTG